MNAYSTYVLFVWSIHMCAHMSTHISALSVHMSKRMSAHMSTHMSTQFQKGDFALLGGVRAEGEAAGAPRGLNVQKGPAGSLMVETTMPTPCTHA